MRSLLSLIVSVAAFLVLPSLANAQALPNVRDCSIASMSGSSQTLFSGTNGQRKWILVCNTGNATLGVNWAGGTAVIAGSSQNLAPGACKEFSSTATALPDPPANAITVIGTAGQPVACYEGK